MRKIALVLVGSGLLAAQNAAAAVTWNWSFAGEEGIFVTDGDYSDGYLAAGRYTMSNFGVTKSKYMPIADMFTISDFGLAYTTFGTGKEQPYTLDWSGSAVTQLNNSNPDTPQLAYAKNSWGFGRWDWSRTYVSFRVADGVSGAGLYSTGIDFDYGEANSAPLSITLSQAPSVPEPATWMTMLVGFAFIGVSLRRRTISYRLAS